MYQLWDSEILLMFSRNIFSLSGNMYMIPSFRYFLDSSNCRLFMSKSTKICSFRFIIIETMCGSFEPSESNRWCSYHWVTVQQQRGTLHLTSNQSGCYLSNFWKNWLPRWVTRGLKKNSGTACWGKQRCSETPANIDL